MCMWYTWYMIWYVAMSKMFYELTHVDKFDT